MAHYCYPNPEKQMEKKLPPPAIQLFQVLKLISTSFFPSNKLELQNECFRTAAAEGGWQQLKQWWRWTALAISSGPSPGGRAPPLHLLLRPGPQLPSPARRGRVTRCHEACCCASLLRAWCPVGWEAEGTMLSKKQMCHCAITRTPGLHCSYSVSSEFTYLLP